MPPGQDSGSRLNPLWRFVSPSDGFGLSIDTRGIALALVGGIIGGVFDVIRGGIRVAFGTVEVILDLARSLVLGGINVLASILPGLIDAGAVETASSLSDFQLLAFPVAILVGVTFTAVILSESVDLGVSFFG